MLNTLLAKVFGTQNERDAQEVDAAGRGDQRAARPACARSATPTCAAQTARVPRAAGRGRDARRPAGRRVRRRARGRPAHAEHAALRRAAHRRHGAAPGQDRRDEDRRGQDAGRDAAGLPERARRQGRARGHGERLPGAPRLGVDGPDLPVPGHDGRRHPARAERRRSASAPTPATSPTAPTTSSGSTTCATT